MRKSGATRYQRGYRIELKVRDILKKEGYFVVRSAGSKGPVDLVAIDKQGKIRLIQVKRVREAREISQVLHQEKERDFFFPVEFWVWIAEERRFVVCERKEETEL